ncbi:MAG: hypothetical protein IPO21_00965 [Bacteroidales bacterium]|nr:hypothetical protein [Bacteroidales bacterium]
MNKIIYGLDEVVIKKKFTQEAFITEIVLMKPKDSISFNLPNMPTAQSQTPPKYKSPLSFGIDEIYNKFSRKGKNKIKAQDLIASSYRIPIINKKYNKTIVEEITNLRDKELEAFMTFCNFTDDYIYQTSEYQLQQMILFKLTIFVSNKTNNADPSQASDKS